MSSVVNCIFCQIVSGNISADIVYRDDTIVCFKDIKPAAPVHLLVVTCEHIDSLSCVGPAHAGALSNMLLIADKLARDNASPDGFRFVINTGRVGCQEVMHLHGHILGGADPLRISRIGAVR
ncbi:MULTISPECIES: HIT domain-containing protein [Candidatus Ichthyocystis]|uniref:HIT domain-containing protein n=1 Tax=Candidatus Ichthyocystis TaxID=2929841 RepID=UPI000B844F8D|nr:MULTISPECIES: HIT domain-containing protein [Ichthyocystis]